jgi:hypothetical protein
MEAIMRSNPRRRRGIRLALGALLTAAVAAGAVRYVTAADHRDAPLTGLDPRADINDVYSFLDPNDPTRLALVMTVDPLIPPTEIGKRFFDPDVLYQFKIDNNGDKVEDLVIYAHAAGTGKFQTMRYVGPVKPNRPGAVTDGIPLSGNYIGRVPVSSGLLPIVGTYGEIKIFAGVRDDPFFFDLTRFQDIIAGRETAFRDPGVDAFAGFNTLALAIELPITMLQAGDRTPIGVWGTTSR